MRKFVAVSAVMAASFVLAAPAAAYVPPVDAPVSRPFDAPASPYAPGNRGIDYRTDFDSPVVAAAAGTVSFAGPVGGHLFVVVAHSDGIRTTYGLLRSAVVSAGDHVESGTLVGRSGAVVHFGARRGDAYLDPAVLFGGARLVPVAAPYERSAGGELVEARPVPVNGSPPAATPAIAATSVATAAAVIAMRSRRRTG